MDRTADNHSNDAHGGRHHTAKQDAEIFDENPKQAENPPSNTVKDPDDWVTGEEKMTGAQASYLKTLSEEAHEAGAFDADLTKAEASKRIDSLKQKAGR